MINQFNDVEVRETAVIYNSNLEQIKEYYAFDPAAAGELAISIIEVALTGQMSTDNPIVKMALANFKEVASKNGIKYDKRVEAKKENRMEKLQLREIARLYLEGHTQKSIAKILGKGASTISDCMKIIRADYSELLQQNSENSEKSDELGELEIGGNPENSDEFGEFLHENPNSNIDSENLPNSENSDELSEFNINSSDSENSENSEHVNDNVNVNENVNVNDNVGRVSSNEETLPSISRQALNQMGATYKDLGNGIIETATGKKMKLDFKYDF